MNARGLDLLSLAYFCGFAGTFAFLIVLEGASTLAHGAVGRWRHIARNVGLFVLLVIVADGVVLTWMMGTPFRLTESDGLLTRLALPAVAQFALGFLVLDGFDYALHRAQHRLRWLWLLHAVHHSDPQLDASTGLRFHPLETTIEVILKATLLLGLGIPLWVEGARAVLHNPASMLQHANVAYPAWVERWFGWLLVTPAMHRVHHAPGQPDIDSNFGTMLSVWDRIFGTYLRPEPGRREVFGLDKLRDDRWQTLVGMVLTPIRARRLGTL